jgi:hypothetical protein
MSKYVPPSMRLKNGMTVPLPDLNDIVSPTERQKRDDADNAKFSRKKNYRKYNNSKPQWEQDKEAAEKAEREKKEADEKAALENTEENFPSLSRPVQKTNSWGGGRKFSELAVEWKAKAEDETVTKNVTDKDTSADGLVLPKFNNIHRFHEPEQEKQVPVQDTDTDTEWKTVRRKAYIPKKKTIEEEIKEEEEKLESDDTVWDTEEKEEHETCWDERRY